MASKEEVFELLKKLNYDEFDVKKEQERPKRLRVLNYVIIPMVFMTILMGIPMIWLYPYLLKQVGIIIIWLLMYMYFLGLFVLKQKQQSFSLNQDLFILVKGAYTIQYALVKKKKLQVVYYTKNPLQWVMKLGTIHFRYKDIFGHVYLKHFEDH